MSGTLDLAYAVVTDYRATLGPTHPGTKWAEFVARRANALLGAPAKPSSQPSTLAVLEPVPLRLRFTEAPQCPAGSNMGTHNAQVAGSIPAIPMKRENHRGSGRLDDRSIGEDL